MRQREALIEAGACNKDELEHRTGGRDAKPGERHTAVRPPGSTTKPMMINVKGKARPTAKNHGLYSYKTASVRVGAPSAASATR